MPQGADSELHRVLPMGYNGCLESMAARRETCTAQSGISRSHKATGFIRARARAVREN